MRRTDLDRLNAQQAHPRVVALWLALQPLRGCISFMNTGAHPDDETTPMLAALALRDGVHLSHACSTRGEGGQNALGLEVTKDLGVVRTREMERAAQVINMTQYWHSASPEDSIFDFGFSKSGDETLQKWGKQRTLERFVQILRRERPDIVCPTFLDISGQHGHHRAMTRAAFEAVKLAADPKAFPNLGLDVWQVKKLYLPAWSGAGDAYDDDVPPPIATTRIDASGYDPVLGADYAQIGQWSRAFHKTQGMGRWVDRGKKSLWPLHLAWSADGVTGEESSVLANLPKNLAELAKFADAPEISKFLIEAQMALDEAIAAWPQDRAIRQAGVKALGLIRKAKENCPPAALGEIAHRLEIKERQIARVLALAADVDCRVSLSKNELRPGEEVEVRVHAFGSGLDIKPELVAPDGWRTSAFKENKAVLGAPSNALPNNPYPDTWFPDRANGAQFVRLSWREGDELVELEVDFEERLEILPQFSAKLSPEVALVNLNAPATVRFSVSNAYPQDAEVSLAAGDNWQVTGAGHEFEVKPEAGISARLYNFDIELNGVQGQTIERMNYEHTGPLLRVKPGGARVRVLEIALPDARIAYIGGGSDRVDHWLSAVGMNVTNLGDERLEKTDFSEFDTILVGIFAFRTRPSLVRRLADIHAWVRQGGNLVTLYHRPWDNWQPEETGLAFLSVGSPSLRWRVTDENAKVTYLEPAHPLLNAPNRISPQDWQGWEKERGLYFASAWSENYTPLLSMADPGEAPLEGSLLSGRFGKGRHTHTSLVLHYQLEKLVPGAYRLLANLLSPA